MGFGQNKNSNKVCSLKDINSKFILQKIFYNLEHKKLLEIIHYNKRIQSLLNIGLNDYINEYLKIEIELIPKKNKYGHFICFKDDYFPYYHFYFNDNIVEIKRNYLNKDDKLKK